MVDFNKIIRPNILSLEPYRCARDDYKIGVLLDANENTHGPAISSISANDELLELNRYPDPHQHDLKQNIIDFRNGKPNKYLNGDDEKLGVDNLCLGVGSDESIDILLRCVCTPGKDKLLVCPPTYGMYSICSTMNDVELVKVPLTYPDFQADVEQIYQNVNNDKNIKLIYLTSPGNPTGKLLNVDSIIELLIKLSEFDVLVVIDEAYIDFTEDVNSETSESMSTLVNKFQNLVVMQTLSKSFGLAGIRLGITYCCTTLSCYLNSMKYPYNISSLTSSIALNATSSGLPIMQKNVQEIIHQRSKLLDHLTTIPGIGKNIGGLDSNFLLLEILNSDNQPDSAVANQLYKILATDNQVVVRFRGNELNCEGCLRISIGTEQENNILIEKIKNVLPTLR